MSNLKNSVNGIKTIGALKQQWIEIWTQWKDNEQYWNEMNKVEGWITAISNEQ